MTETMSIQQIVDLLAPVKQTPASILDSAISKVAEYKTAGVDLELARAVNLVSSEDDKLAMDLKRSVSNAITSKSLSVYKQIGNCLDDWEIKIDKKFSRWLKKIQADFGISIPPIFNNEPDQKTIRKKKIELRHEDVKNVINSIQEEDPSFDPFNLEPGMKRVIYERCKKKSLSLFAITFETFHSEYWNSDLRKQLLKVKDEKKFKS
ncbi:MAG: hypothetical protein JAY97_11465 [Candidatus Thiodiazotropha sp. 'RUGA']|nr:hypothetical protein [Candidatus Thiodiazotropha sp. 'RUGA']